MKCPKCNSVQSKCNDTRYRAGTVYRRRECLTCGARFSTQEISLDEYDAMQKAMRAMQESMNNMLQKFRKIRTTILTTIDE